MTVRVKMQGGTMEQFGSAAMLGIVARRCRELEVTTLGALQDTGELVNEVCEPLDRQIF